MTIKKVFEKIILIIVTISILIAFTVTPVANAGLGLKEGEFYYSGTTQGTYVLSEGIFSWLLDNLGMIADWILGLMTMGPRMVFVGWAALIEKLLTWTLEQTAGVNNAGGFVVDSTDVTAIGDSSGNVTVQAIVYNQVPLFDINFFNLEFDRTVSGTGHKLNCKTCGRTCEECCQIADESKVGTSEASATCVGDCKCDDNETNTPCDSCDAYIKNLQAEDPMVIKIRQAVALWYSVIRLLAMVAMLIVLIAIGIKMALSTIASEKAVYKRMFVDWVVGMIILFSIHYIMIFVININETMVNTIKETANSVNKTQLKYVTAGKEGEEEGTQEVSDEEIEISIYEEIRTRAYEPKLSIGLTGMLMYMTLIYFAVRYSLVYLKRYLTVIVLALMAPPVGVAYALQKVLSGKSSTLKTWMTEFIMNVIIQIVHALVYAVFVSTALALSLESVPGMVVALIFMNFTLKTEKMFREIFKMGESGSLLSSAAEAGDADKIHQNIRKATGLYMSAKPVANAMLNTPVAKMWKSAGKIGLAGAATGITAAGKAGEKLNDTKAVKTVKQVGSTVGNKVSGAYGSAKSRVQGVIDNVWGTDGNGSAPTQQQAAPSNQPKTSDEKDLADQKLIKTGGEVLGQKAAQAAVKMSTLSPDDKERESLQKDIDNYFRYQELMSEGDVHKIPSTGSIALGHIKRAVNIENHYKSNYSGQGPIGLYRNIFGTRHYDKKSGKMVYDGNGYFSQFNAANLLGLSKDDIKEIKEQGLAPLKGVAAMGAMFVGLGTVVSHPTLGGAMFVGGTHVYNKAFRVAPGKKDYKGKYVNARFSAATVQNAQKNLVQQAYNAIDRNQALFDSETVRRVKDEHPDLYRDIMNGLKQGTTDISLSGRKGKFTKKVGSALGFAPKAVGLFDVGAYSAGMDQIKRSSLVRARHEVAEFEKESSGLIKIGHKLEMDNLIKEHDNLIAKDVKENIGRYTKEYSQLGFSADSTDKGKLVKTKRVTDKDVINPVKADEIEKIIDDVLVNMYKTSDENQVDLSNNKELAKAIQAVSYRIKKSDNLLSNKKQNPEILFTDGEETLKAILIDKAQIFNNQTSTIRKSTTESEAKAKLNDILSSKKTGFSKEEQQLIKQIIAKNSGIEGFSAEELMKHFTDERGRIQASKGIKKSEKLDKVKKKAMKDFLKKFEDFQIGEVTAEQVVSTVSEKAVKESRKKINTVLAYMEQEGETISEAVSATEQLIKSRKDGKITIRARDDVKKVLKRDKSGKLVVGIETKEEKDSDGITKKKQVIETKEEETIDFNDTEYEMLNKLFNKMKEEIVFNEYTKNILDQSDSQKTKEAKRQMYNNHVDYLVAQRDMLLERENIANSYSAYGITSSSVGEMLDGESVSTKVDEIIGKLGSDDINNIMKKEDKFKSGINLEDGKRFSDLNTDDQEKVKKNISSFLDNELSKEVKRVKDDVRNEKIRYEAAKKRAALVGKIDINSQINDLLIK